MREAVAHIGDVDDGAWREIREVIERIGVTTIESMKPAIAVEADSVTTARVEPVIAAFGGKAVTRLASLVGDPRWFVQLRAAQPLGRIAAPPPVPLPPPPLRQPHPPLARPALPARGPA